MTTQDATAEPVTETVSQTVTERYVVTSAAQPLDTRLTGHDALLAAGETVLSARRHGLTYRAAAERIAAHTPVLLSPRGRYTWTWREARRAAAAVVLTAEPELSEPMLYHRLRRWTRSEVTQRRRGDALASQPTQLADALESCLDALDGEPERER